MQYLDIEDAKRLLAEQRRESDSHLNAGGIQGPVARSADIHEAVTLWRIGEQNRRSDPNAVLTAMLNIFANHIAAELEINVRPEFYSDTITHIASAFAYRVSEALKNMDGHPFIEPKEVGLA